MGLKIYGAGEWQREKHGERDRRNWRQLHLAIDPHNHEILASDLTTNDVGDPSMTEPLLGQVPSVIVSVTTDVELIQAPTQWQSIPCARLESSRSTRRALPTAG
jgi:hypothetical protein